MTYVTNYSATITNNTTLNIPNVDPGIGSNRRLFVVISNAEGDTPTNLVISSVTFAPGEAEEQACSSVVAGHDSDSAGTGIYEILHAVLPTGGSPDYTVRVICAGQCWRINAAVLVYNDMSQEAVDDSSHFGRGNVSSGTVTTTLSVSQDTSFILAVVGMHNNTNWPSAFTDSPTQRFITDTNSACTEVAEWEKDEGSYSPAWTVNGYYGGADISAMALEPLDTSLYEGIIDQSPTGIAKNTYVKIATVAPTDNTLTVTISAAGSVGSDVVVADNVGITLVE